MANKKNILIFIIIAILFYSFIAYFSYGVLKANEHSFQAYLMQSILRNKLEVESGINKFLLTKKQSYASIIFVGDVMLSRSIGRNMEKLNDYKFPFRKSYKFLRDADITFANLENPISLRGENQGSKYSFRANPKVISGLKYAGFDVLSIANNHIMDWGKGALIDTIELLKTNNIIPVGAGKNYKDANSVKVFDIDGKRIGFLAYTNLYPKSFCATKSGVGISNFDKNKIIKYISYLKQNKKIDFLIISLHWGVEYSKIPTENQIKFAHKLIDAGADIIVGHHPHIVQKIEKYKNKLIMYSLGNFVFDQYFSEDTMSSIAVKIIVEKNNLISFIYKYKVVINKNYQPIIIKKLNKTML